MSQNALHFTKTLLSEPKFSYAYRPRLFYAFALLLHTLTVSHLYTIMLGGFLSNFHSVDTSSN